MTLCAAMDVWISRLITRDESSLIVLATNCIVCVGQNRKSPALTTHKQMASWRDKTEPLVKCLSDKKNWAQGLFPILFAYRTSKHASTGFTPFRVLYNRDARLPIEMEFQRSVSDSDDSEPVDPQCTELEKRSKVMEDIQKRMYENAWGKNTYKLKNSDGVALQKKANGCNLKSYNDHDDNDASFTSSPQPKKQVCDNESVEIVHQEEISTIDYLPVCGNWQKDRSL